MIGHTMMFAVVAFAIAAVRPGEASACSCRRQGVTISPSGAGAPINSTVVVWLRGQAPNEMTVYLRKKVDGDPVAVNYRSMGGARLPVVEMIPRTKLEPNTAYEVFMFKGEHAHELVGAFTTGTAALTGAPAFQGIASASYHHQKAVCCNCSTGNPYARIDLKDKIADDQVGRTRFAVWTSDAAGKIDYTAPPATYVPAAGVIYLGDSSICSSANLTFPKQKVLKLGIKHVDLAGNASAVSEVTLDTSKPVARER